MITTSSDFSSFSSATTGSFNSNSLNGLTHDGSNFVAVGGDTYAQTSTDGSTWTSKTAANMQANMQSVAFGNSMYVAVGTNGTIMTNSTY